MFRDVIIMKLYQAPLTEIIFITFIIFALKVDSQLGGRELHPKQSLHFSAPQPMRA